MAAKELLLAHCSSASAAASIAAILQSSSDIKIAVPCAVLSPQAKHSASKVVVAVKGSTPAGELQLDCGSFWKGAPTHLVKMSVCTLLEYANEDTARVLAKKLHLEVPATTARPPSRAGATSCKQDGSSPSLASRPASRSRSSGRPLSAPAIAYNRQGPASKSAWCQSRAAVEPATAAAGMEQLQGAPEEIMPVSTTATIPSAAHAVAGSMYCTAEQGEASDSDEDCPKMPTPFKTSSPKYAAMGSPLRDIGHLLSEESEPKLPPPPTNSPRTAPAAPGSRAAAEAAAALLGDLSRALSLADWVAEPEARAAAEAGAEFGWLESHRPPLASCGGGGRSPRGAPFLPPLQFPTEVQQFAADSDESSSGDEEEWWQGGLQLPASTGRVPGRAMPAGRNPQARRAAEQEEIAASPFASASPLSCSSGSSQRRPANDSFSRVFFAPWSAVSDTATQTGTALAGASGATSPRGAAGSQDGASAHFEHFQQHLAAALPHLAMCVADLAAAHGGRSVLFSKAHLYFKTCLQIKDELEEIMERHREGA